MAGEALLLSGDQIATYTNANVTFPGGVSTIDLQGLSTLGNDSSRFFLVRGSGDGDVITNGQNFAIYNAVDDGTGTLVPGPSPIVSATFATPDAYDDTGAGDDYIIFGLFGGSQFAVDLSGFGAQSTATFVEGQDTSPGGDGELSITEIQAANPDGPVICFARGTLIRTPDGDTAIEKLKTGDKVCLPDGQPGSIRWISRRRIQLRQANRHLAPVRICRNAFGLNKPFRDLVVSPNHRILHQSAVAELWFDTPLVLIPAKFLIDNASVTRETHRPSVEYWHFLLDDHEVVYSNGLPTESLHLGDVALDCMAEASRAELFEIFPALARLEKKHLHTRHRALRRYEAMVLARSQDRHDA